MKIFYLLAMLVSAGLALSAQDQGTIPQLNRKMVSFFDQHPIEKVFVTTDKISYKPGETIWFRAFVTDGFLQPSQKGNKELVAKFYDAKGMHSVFVLQ